ncbi:MAG: hypothetical protein AMXMBFR47_44070 [Planctomycetota bacterium]
MWWVLKWAGTVACTVCVAGAGITLVRPTADLVFGSRFRMYVSGGALVLHAEGKDWFEAIAHATVIECGSVVTDVRVAGDADSQAWREIVGNWRDRALCPELFDLSPYFQEVSLPLWIPFAAIGAPTVWLWWRERRRMGPGCCGDCGYDLTGNVSGRCPECGEAIASGGSGR